MDCQYVFKILLIGDSGVGKTSLMNRFVDNIFEETFVSTIGVDFKIKTIAIEGKIVKLQLWDTAGQERFKTITRSYYRGSHGVIIIYDVTDKETFKNIPYWLKEVEKFAGPRVEKVLIGTKIDLNERQVSCEEALNFSNKHGLRYVEASAKSSDNVETIFITISNMIRDKVNKTVRVEEPIVGNQRFLNLDSDTQSINLDSVNYSKPEECCF